MPIPDFCGLVVLDNIFAGYPLGGWLDYYEQFGLNMSEKILNHWLAAEITDVGRHIVTLLTEIDGARAKVIMDVQELARAHYVDPGIMAKRLAELGAPRTAKLLKENLPKGKRARSGDIGEILATEVAEHYLHYNVPVRRLRWKDGREAALRGDDLIGLSRDEKGSLRFLKGEAKSRAALTSTVLSDAGRTLDRYRGQPSRHSVLFIATRLREKGMDELAKELEQAVLASFKGIHIEHFLFTLSGNNAKKLLLTHLETCAKKKRRRYATGIRIKDHSEFISDFFEGL